MASPWSSPARGISGTSAEDAPLRALPQIEPLIHCSSFCFGWAPIWRDASWPSLNSIKVGIDMIPYLAAVPGFSSTLSLTIFTLPLSELEISSSAGAIIRHGPHHSAQKSTTTGPVALSTSFSNVASVTFSTMEYLVFQGVVGSGKSAESAAQMNRALNV